jgi:ketosteroid isomerase-like protein
MHTTTSTTTDVAALLREGYDCFARGDVPGAMSRFSPDIVWTIPGPRGLEGVYRGHAGVGDFFGKIAAAWSHQVLSLDEILVDGERAVVLGRHDIAGANGSCDIAFAHVWQVRDGLATSFMELTDTQELARVLGD